MCMLFVSEAPTTDRTRTVKNRGWSDVRWEESTQGGICCSQFEAKALKPDLTTKSWVLLKNKISAHLTSQAFDGKPALESLLFSPCLSTGGSGLQTSADTPLWIKMGSVSLCFHGKPGNEQSSKKRRSKLQKLWQSVRCDRSWMMNLLWWERSLCKGICSSATLGAEGSAAVALPAEFWIWWTRSVFGNSAEWKQSGGTGQRQKRTLRERRCILYTILVRWTLQVGEEFHCIP